MGRLTNRKKEYELVYGSKERKENILAETMRAPLQEVKTFRNGIKTKNGWTNKLIFGDNLQVLKELMYDPKVKGKVKLIYIDPPFATKQEFRGSQDQKAYQDKIAGAKFLEFLRKRLIFLREILADDGSIYVHLDWKKGHYVKILMDEIFGEQNFVNEIVWKKYAGVKNQASRKFTTQTDNIFLYSKTGNHIFNQPFREMSEAYIKQEYKYINKKGRRYALLRGREYQETGEHKHKYLDEVKGAPVTTLWDDEGLQLNTSSIERNIGFPTQKPEALLERIIKASSNTGDIVLDAFAGSGTALAVAEKLGRKWIGIDSSKLAIYTIQKRLLRIQESKNLENPKEKYKKLAKPFALYNAGLYDYQKLKELSFEKYRDFALKLFQCRDEKHRISKIDLDGYLGSYDVLVFDYQKYKDVVLDYKFIDNLHSILGDKIRNWFFIITPAANVQFLEDYVEKPTSAKALAGKDGTKYFILRIPYSMIAEIHEKGFFFIKQPKSEKDVNDIMEAVGFDFIQVPKTRCEYRLMKPRRGQNKLGQPKKEAVIKIKTFQSETLSKEAQNLKNLESLSMVMIDYDYNGKVFDLDDVFYAEDLRNEKYEIRFNPAKIDKQMMIIYCDIFGNEKREIKKLKDFKI